MEKETSVVIIKNVAGVRALLAGLLALGVLSANTISAQSVDDLIAERIKPVGEVCLAGDTCTGNNNSSNTTAQTTADTGGATSGFDAEATYMQSCFACHSTGAAGAPKVGDAEAWATRLEKGMEVLIASSVDGLNGVMPPKGLCFTCSDEDLAAIVQYMLDNSQ